MYTYIETINFLLSLRLLLAVTVHMLSSLMAQCLLVARAPMADWGTGALRVRLP